MKQKVYGRTDNKVKLDNRDRSKLICDSRVYRINSSVFWQLYRARNFIVINISDKRRSNGVLMKEVALIQVTSVGQTQPGFRIHPRAVARRTLRDDCTRHYSGLS